MNLDELRQRAEQALRDGQINPAAEGLEPLREVRELLEELRIYQAELELQNEALREAQHELAVAADKYRTLFEQLPLPALVVDQWGFICEANTLAHEWLGLSGIDRGLSPVLRLFEPAARGRVTQALQERAQPRCLEWLTTRTAAEPVPCDLHLMPLHPAAGAERRTLLVLVDQRQRAALLEQRRREASMLAARDEAEAASRAKSLFLAHMSHEIRTPLNAILGFTQVLQRDPALGPAHRDQLGTIQRSGEHLLNLINDILDMARIEAGQMVSHVGAFAPSALLAELEAMFQASTLARGLQLAIDTVGLPPVLIGDKLHLEQVLINLLGNAIKFTPQGRVTLRVEQVPPEPDRGTPPTRSDQPGAGGPAAAAYRLRFSVCDTGIGIAQEELALLFRPFTQSATGWAGQEGSGLGLALSQALVRLMGGELGVDSTPGRGSCFSFTLDFAAAGVDRLAPDQDAVAPVVGLLPGQPMRRILIADDHADNRAPLRALLEWLNPTPPVLQLREAGNGEEVLAIWEEWQPQVIFLDMRMPTLGGAATARRLRARALERPDAVRTLIIALTASAFDRDRAQVLAAGCDAFARKPFVAEELFTILERRAGLRFVRAGACPPLPAARIPTEDLPAHLARHPAPWREALADAVRLGDYRRIGALLEDVREADPALYGTLALAAWDFNLELFDQALRGA